MLERLIGPLLGPEAARLLARLADNAPSVVQAQAWLTTSAYTPPLTTTTTRDAWCAAHHADPAPLPYAFGTAS